MTTQWQSMFAAGPCTVSVYKPNNIVEPIYSGTLTFNQQSAPFTFNNIPNAAHVAVDANGVAGLWNDNGYPFDCTGYTLRVTPQYDVSALLTQMTSIMAPWVPAGTYAALAGDASNSGTPVALSIDTTGTPTPDQATFAALAGARLSFYTAGGGG